MCTTSFHPPPFGEGSKFLNSVRASNLAWLPPTVYSNCSEAVCLAARTLLLRCREVSTPTILPNFICNCRDSVVFAFGGGIGKREKEEAYIKESYVRQVLSYFNSIALATLACRHMRSLQLLCTVGGNLASSRAEAK